MNELPGPVRGAVIDDEQFIIGVRLRENASDGLGQVIRAVIDRDYNAYRRIPVFLSLPVEISHNDLGNGIAHVLSQIFRGDAPLPCRSKNRLYAPVN